VRIRLPVDVWDSDGSPMLVLTAGTCVFLRMWEALNVDSTCVQARGRASGGVYGYG